MSSLNPKGSPLAPIWVIAEKPYSSDVAKGFLFSGGMGYMFDKMMQEAEIRDYYVIARRPDLDSPSSIDIIESHLNHYKPPIVVVLDEAGKILCPQLAKKPKKGQSPDDTEIEKFAGSLLTSPLLTYPHYIIPTYDLQDIQARWKLRDIAVALDLGKAKSELDFFQANGHLQPLSERVLKYEMDFEETIQTLRTFLSEKKLLSIDIETVYTNTKSVFYPHPGLPVTIGIANSPIFGISFNLFWPKLSQNLELWRLLESILWECPNLGQNYFNFDTSFLNALGFRIELEKVQDTLLRHHILWPELPHKLQFQTRQYTREPYYKDDGKKWNLKDMVQLRRYNCLDVCVTYEVFLEQEKEFDERPYLR
jgi:hypothetical protein